MNQFSIVIADDDATAREILNHYIELVPDFRIIGEAPNGTELIPLVLTKKPDIIIVDIDMPGLNGLDAVKSLKELFPSLAVIFTTGHTEFAVDAFDISATDYVIKPIDTTRFFKALEKAKKLVQMQKDVSTMTNDSKKTLTVRTMNAHLYLPVDDILFVEKEGRKTVIYTGYDRFETNESLQELEVRLQPVFFKTHRSFLVNLEKIIKIEVMGESYIAHFSNFNKTAHISKLKIQEVQNYFKQILQDDETP
ncbi:LytR/AlgR family response regulator transcription factor [Bacillus sp. V33-4]|uniref:LytR/AlgR family response regulator transcription factor n=1 Tax=Bacillus sp. V33-4 TaxID=2054169 RepID=UPI000C7634F2|nr:LytTR family DNA-binding domain-containing protein [Bacillus sp. V33-4]PLR81368.1 DNA-binding response regulator [Bacillus sp. V33-4]